jgi:hypothetical protein
MKALHLASQSLEESTISTYSWAFRRFLRYCKLQQRVWTEVATSVGGMACFMGHLYEAGIKPGTIPSMVSAVNKVVSDFGLEKPEHSLLLSIIQALKKEALQQITTRATMESGVLVKIMEEIRTLITQRRTRSSTRETYQSELRIHVQSALAVVLGFVFMLRRSSIWTKAKKGDPIFLQRGDLQFVSQSRVDLFIRFEKGKKVQRKLTVRGYVADWISLLQPYLPTNKEDYLFHHAQQAMSQDVQVMLMHWLDRLHISPPTGMKFQWHSLRKGGATAAHICGAETVTLQHFGGWKTTESLTKSYIDFSHLLVEEDSLLMQFLCPGQMG